MHEPPNFKSDTPPMSAHRDAGQRHVGQQDANRQDAGQPDAAHQGPGQRDAGHRDTAPPSGRVAVVGAGTMGAGIAQLAAMHGFTVSLVDVERALLDRAREAMRASLERLHARGRISEPPDAVLARIRSVADPQADVPHAAEVTVAVEAVPEDPALKAQVLQALEAKVPAGALIATNTSGIPLERLSGALSHPARFLAIHFFNPVVRQRIVEVVRAPETSDDAFEAGLGFVQALGRDPLPVERSLPGFVLNRIAMTASNEAIRLVAEGVVSAKDLDRGVRGAFGWKMGPLETADLVGLDVVLAARQAIYEATGDERFRPPDLLRQLVREGKLGRKTGQGFHCYDSQAPPGA